MAITGPKKIIDLDVLPEGDWKIETGALHLYHDKLWKYEQTGCVLCAECERGDAHGQTLSSISDSKQFLCLTHGILEEVKYTITRQVTVKIGEFERTASQSIEDAVLMPVDMEQDERNEILDRLVSAATESEMDPEMDIENG